MRSYRAQLKNINMTINITPMRINLWLSISLFLNTRVETIANGLLSKNAKFKNLMVGKPSKGSKDRSQQSAPVTDIDRFFLGAAK